MSVAWTKMAKIEKTKLVLFAILIIASVLRLWSLDKVPVSLFGDEVDVGYHAYSILRTGRDYMGQFLPTYIHSLSEWRAPLFIYSAVPTVAIFGPNELGVRLPAAIFGIFGVLLIYLLGKKLFSEQVALIASFFMAILPWHIHYSRAAFEVTLLLDLLLLGTFLFFVLRRAALLLSAFVFALTFYTYSTAVVFTPLYILFLFFLKRKDVARESLVAFLIIFSILILPFAKMTISGEAAGRFSLLSVFSDEQIIDTINRERTQTSLPYERIFHNKLIAWGGVIVSNYARSLSPEFLFVSGDPNPRHSVPGVGLFYWGILPFLLVGLYKIVSVKRNVALITLSWLLLAPVPASLTSDGGSHATRLFLLIPPLVVLSALGADWLANQRLKIAKIVFLGITFLLALNLAGYWERYMNHYNLATWRWWHYGYKEAMQAVGENQQNFRLVFINNTFEPSLLHYLFWTGYSPREFQQKFTSDVPKEEIYPGFDGFALGENLYFGQAGNLPEFLEKGMLYLAVQGKEIPGDWDWEKDPPKGVSALKVVRTPQGESLFTLITKTQE